MERRDVHPSLSPSMDIQVSSNFERLLFELLGRDGKAVKEAMQNFSERGRFSVEDTVLQSALQVFSGYRLDDAGSSAR